MTRDSIFCHLRDAWLEIRIQAALRRLLNAAPDSRQQRCLEFTYLIRQRSPQQVARMERMKGLI